VIPTRASARTSLKRHSVLLAGLVALLPVVAFAGFTFFHAHGAFRAADEARLRDTARALAAALDAQLGTYVTALETLAISRLLDGPLDVDAFEVRARSVGDRLGGWIVLLEEPPHYQMLANTRRQPGAPLPSALVPEQQGALLQAYSALFAEGRPIISDLFQGALTAGPVLAVMIPVDRPGQSRRALALAIEPALLRSLLTRQSLPPGTFAAVADGQLRILAHSFDPEGRRAGVRAPDWVNAAIAGKERALVVGPGWSGQDNVYAVERLNLAPGWTVTVAEPLAVQQALAWAALRWLLAGGAALGLGLAVVVWASRREALNDARDEAEALRIGRAEVERLHDGLPAIVFLREVATDGTNRLLYRGGDIEMVTGWPAATFAGEDNFQFLVDLEADDYHAFFDRVVRDGTGTIEYRMRQPDGSWRSLRSRCRVLGRRTDGTWEVVGYILDVSAEREAEARAMATARLASLGEMAAGLAHEIKQPLQSISLAAEVGQIAAARGDAAGVDERFEHIVEQTQRTARTIEHLRRFARGTEEGAPSRAVVLATAIQGALDLARSQLRDARIEVEVDFGGSSPVVQGQELLLERVLSNLLLNARDALAARPDGAPRRIRIAAAPGLDGTVRLTVADTGGGIAPEVMARLFEPFVTTKGPETGTGLGLSICHSLVKGMGGSIEAHNDAEGAVFTITLPGIVQDETHDQETPNA
jgi:C4-dicarboxylate-specific signal transduction histidine kinase